MMQYLFLLILASLLGTVYEAADGPGTEAIAPSHDRPVAAGVAPGGFVAAPPPTETPPGPVVVDGLPAGSAPNANLVTYLDISPSVVDISGTENVNIWVQTDGTVTSAEVEHFNGSTYPLTDYGGGLFGTTLSHDLALYNYAHTSYPNVNRFGYINLYQGSTQVLHGWLSVGVEDGQIPSVSVSSVASDMQATPHLVNLVWSFSDPSQIDQQAVAKRFYQVYGDDYDFLNIISTPSYFGNRYHYEVRNAVSGIGLSIFDNSADFGSSGQLLGITRFPIPVFYFDGAERTMSHETAHQWLQNLSQVSELQGVTPHWPISELARSVLGYSTPGGQGLSFPWDLTPQGNGDYVMHYNPLADQYFQAMDLYLMGLAEANEVGTYAVFTDQSQSLCNGCTLYGPTVNVDVQDVIAQYGARNPTYPNAKTHFRLANIIVSQSFLSAREMRYYDYFARRGEATIPIQGNYPWAVATWERSTISMGLGTECGDDSASTATDLLFFSHHTTPSPPRVGQNFSLTASASNWSSNTAHHITFFTEIPKGLEFVSAELNGSSTACYGDELIVCARDTMQGWESVTLEITMRAAQAGSFEHRVGVSSCNYDWFPSDNDSSTTIRVEANKVFLPLVTKP